MNNFIYYIYKITNLINGKIYIGQHQQLRTKKDTYFGSGRLLIKAIKKYGKKNFKKEILCYCQSKQQLNQLEKFYVTEDFVKDENTYNLRSGGNAAQYISDETRERLGISHLGHKHTQQTKKKLSKILKNRQPFIRRKLTQEEKQIVKAKANQTMLKKYGVKQFSQTQQFKQLMSKKMSGKNNPFFNHKHTQQTKEINRQKHLGANNARFGKPGTWKNRKRSQQSKEKTSLTLKKYYKTHEMIISQETKQKIRKTNYLKTAKKLNLNNNQCIRYAEYHLNLFNNGIKIHKIGFVKDNGEII